MKYGEEPGFIEAKDLQSEYKVTNVGNKTSFIEKVRLVVVETPEMMCNFR